MSARAAAFVIAGVLASHLGLAQAPPRDPRPPLRAPSETMAEILASARSSIDRGEIDQAMTALDAVMKKYPRDAEVAHEVAVFYWDKAFRDTTLTDLKRRYLAAGIAAEDRALAINPDSVNALTFKNIILRLQANLETDPTVRQRLLAEADALRTRAAALARQQRDAGSPAPIRVGGNIPQPQKTKHASPVYPGDAQSAGVSGAVICEVTVGVDGTVTDVRVLKSVPLLDAAAVAAVRQWEFTPTLLNGKAVPVIMTVSVNFTLQKSR